eukprot:3476061-Amphidinium_carterae.1
MAWCTLNQKGNRTTLCAQSCNHAYAAPLGSIMSVSAEGWCFLRTCASFAGGAGIGKLDDGGFGFAKRAKVDKSTSESSLADLVRTKDLVPEEDDPLLLLVIHNPAHLHASLACAGSPVAPGPDAAESMATFVAWFRNRAHEVKANCWGTFDDNDKTFYMTGLNEEQDVMNQAITIAGKLSILHMWMSELCNHGYQRAISVYQVDKRLPAACNPDRDCSWTQACLISHSRLIATHDSHVSQKIHLIKAIRSRTKRIPTNTIRCWSAECVIMASIDMQQCKFTLRVFSDISATGRCIASKSRLLESDDVLCGKVDAIPLAVDLRSLNPFRIPGIFAG